MTSVYILANETPTMRANRLELEQRLAEYRRYQQTDEYKSAEAEKERRRRENLEGWFAFASAGGATARNLQIALYREGK